MAQEKQYDVAVSAQTQYLPDQSDETGSRYVFAYTVTIHNAGRVAAQLISRHWIITDSQGWCRKFAG
jgi:ApaG protein